MMPGKRNNSNSKSGNRKDYRQNKYKCAFPDLDYFTLSFIQQFSSEMSSRVLFKSLKSLLTSMMCLGIFPWRFVQEDDKTSPVPHLKPLDWKIHMAIFLVNVTIWSLPFDVHFWYGLLFALHPNESQNSSNGLGQIRNESSLILFLLVITNNLLIFYGIPLMHHLHILLSRNRICEFYTDIQTQLDHFRSVHLHLIF